MLANTNLYKLYRNVARNNFFHGEQIGISVANFVRWKVRNHFRNNGLSLRFPLCTIIEGVIKAFIRADTKHTAFLELFGQGDDVVIKEAKLACSIGIRQSMQGERQ